MEDQSQVAPTADQAQEVSTPVEEVKAPETQTLDCGCINTLISRQGKVECWGLTTECATHQAQREASAAASYLNMQKQDILNQLSQIDFKSIRAIRENDTARMATWETQAKTLRDQLAKLG